MKHTVIDDVFSIMCPGGAMPDVKAYRVPTPEQMGSFQVG
jgi:hypothetical protein